MTMLKLMHLPHGTNRNRTLRRATDAQEEEVNFVEVERLFRRFWRPWCGSEVVTVTKGAGDE